MEILSLIKDKLTDSVIDKVSGFLGEHPEKISPALQSAVPTVLASIIQNASTDEATGKIMDVLKDGGHSGEILDDLTGLLSNFDKTQLLITIGTNIFNHFSGEKSNSIVEKLSSLNGIRKTSAASLLGLSAPLVLGAIGKVVAKEGLGVSGLTKLLNDQKEGVLGAMPPALSSILSIKNNTNSHSQNTEKTEKPKETATTGKTNWAIPLLLLGLLSLGILAYLFKDKIQSFLKPKPKIAVELPMTDSTTKADDFMSAPIDTIKKETPKTETQNKVTEPIAKPKLEEKTIEKIEAPTTSTITSSGSLSENLKTGSSWFGITTDFGKTNAEIKKKGDLDEVVKYLKSNKKAKLQISGGSENSSKRLAEDRAWAVFGYLIEKGVSENQIEVASKQQTTAGGNVVLKVLKR